MSGLYRDEAVVLRTQKLGESDRIITLLTRSNGRVRAVGKGVRRTSSRFGARLEPFSHVDLQLYVGRSLDIVTQVESITQFGAGLAAMSLWALPVVSFFGSLAAAALLFFVPTFFSGMVSPYCVRLLVEDERSSGRRAGQLYFVSTFGSAAGTIVTSFYLVLWLEVNVIFISMIAVSVVLAALVGVTKGNKA